MIRLCVFTTVLAVALASNGCSVSEWGPWTEWTKPGCTRQGELSSQEPVAPIIDKGRIAREFMMERKDQIYEDLVKSRRDGTYPTVNQPVGAVDCVNGFAGAYPCSNVDQIAFFDFQELCGSDCGQPLEDMVSCDSWGWTDPSDGTEYAIHTMDSGTSFVRLNSDYSLPTVLAFMGGFGTLIRHWRDAKVIGNFAYIGSETYDHGLQVFDMTRLRSINSYTVVQPDVTYMGFGNSHNIVASPASNTIFGTGTTGNGPGYTTCSGGLHAVDVSDPLNPTFAGCFDADDYTHDAQCLIYNGPDVNYQGREICFNFNEDSLTIADVTDKANMVQISRSIYTNNEYTHQGWLTEDHTLLLMDDELDEYYSTTDKTQRTHIWDLTSLAAPVLQRTFYSEKMVIDHNLYIIGDKVYQANYEEGLRILQLDQAAYDMTEIGFFDFHIPANLVDFYGIWNAYPFFASGQIVCSVIETGLFIVKPDLPAMNQLVYNGNVMTERLRYRSILSADDLSSCPSLIEVDQMPVPNTC